MVGNKFVAIVLSTLFFSCCVGNLSQDRPGSIWRCGLVYFQDASSVDWESIQDSLISISDSNDFIRNVVIPEKNGFIRGKRFLVYFDSLPREYAIIQPEFVSDSVIILGIVNGDSGYARKLDCNKIRNDDLNRISERIRIVLKERN